ncbi:flagellar hook-length control protein FliK [Stenotrophomonas sp.]|uniref:flagellar hook-length control protein FliK n=1 Tax=Stenotrophomonas sp. TaxID=69392 RepID=UPI0028AB9E33|nr:flagellar hook-length control protein FliK [Stenotrophomonas sp.]
MTPASVLGGSPATATAGKSGGTPRSGTGDGDARRDFDTLLKNDAGSAKRVGASDGKPAPATPTADDGRGTGADRPTRGSRETTPPTDGDTASEATASTPSTPDAQDSIDPADTAPWPPFGLAGLALAGVEPQPSVPPPTTTATTTLPGAVVAPAAATGAPTGPLAVPADAGTGPAALLLPVDAEPTPDAELLKTVTDAITAAGDGADAPPTPLLHALNAAAELKTSAPAAPFTGAPTATPHLGGDDFEDAVSARIGWLADQKIGHAHIRITPDDLGPIDVRLHLDGDKVHASFTSAHADVRHALESSLPRLREMLNEQGFQLGNADVGQQQTAQDGKAGDGRSGLAGDDGEPSLADATVSPAQLMRQRGLVDAYA